MRASHAVLVLFALTLGSCRAYVMGAMPSVRLGSSRVAAVMASTGEESSAATAAGDESSGEDSAMAAADDAAVTERAAPKETPVTVLEESDLINTRWSVSFTPRPDAWRVGEPCEQEFALLKDGSVRWAGEAGGTGVGGRWQLRGETLEVIRTTPLGLITGRDYYMSYVNAQVRARPLASGHGPGRTGPLGSGTPAYRATQQLAASPGDERPAVRDRGHHALLQLALPRGRDRRLEGQAAAGPLRRSRRRRRRRRRGQ